MEEKVEKGVEEQVKRKRLTGERRGERDWWRSEK